MTVSCVGGHAIFASSPPKRAVGNKVEMGAAQTAVIQTMIPAVLVWQEFSALENKLTQSIKGIPPKKIRTTCPDFLGGVPLFFLGGLQVGQTPWCAWPAKPRTEAARRRELTLKGGGGVHGFSVPCASNTASGASLQTALKNFVVP